MNLLSYDVDNKHSGRGFDPHHLHQKEISMKRMIIKEGQNEVPPSFTRTTKKFTSAGTENIWLYV